MITICHTWGTANVQWKNGDWTWEECQIVQNIVECLKWGEASVIWNMTDNKWTTECPTPPPGPTGSYANLGVDATTLIQPWLEEPWNPYRVGEKTKKRKLIELICKVKGREFDEKKYSNDVKITVEDVRLVVKKVANMDFNIKIKDASIYPIHRPK